MSDDSIKRSDAIRAVSKVDDYGDGIGFEVKSHCLVELELVPSADRPKDKWIPIKWHYITDEEREESGYPKDWVYYLDCEMPEDGQEILVTTKHGYVEKDVCYLDDGYSLDSGWDWIEDIVAWMPLPEPWKDGEEE